MFSHIVSAIALSASPVSDGGPLQDVSAHQAASGKEIINRMPFRFPKPVRIPGLCELIGGGSFKCMMNLPAGSKLPIKPNHQDVDSLFDSMDLNGDGVIDRKEFETYKTASRLMSDILNGKAQLRDFMERVGT